MIAAVAMVRDEADILPAFLAHATALFDLVLVADHASRDATPGILAGAAASGLPVASWRVTTAGYWQSAVTDCLAREAFARGATWVAPLDADEFLDIADAPALRALLAQQTAPVVAFRWRHAVPVAAVLEGHAAPRWPAPDWLANPAPAPPGLGKVMLHRDAAARLPGWSFGAGNHSLQGVPFAKALTGPTIGTLWHLPVRSRAQFMAKLARDLGSHLGADGRPVGGMGEAAALKRALFARLAGAPEDAALLQRVALGYWEQGAGCLDAAAPAPVPVAPRIAMRALPQAIAPGLAAATPAAEALPVGTLVAEGRLEGDRLRVLPASPRRQRAAALEAWLKRRFTPGLRLARFLGTRRLRRRLAEPVAR